MRVISGEAKGRRLRAPTGEGTRPTSDRVREAVFNSLQALVDMDEANVADLFAGSGAMGIEALSRGAARCTFVESDRRAAEVIAANLDTTNLTTKGRIVRQDAVRWLSTAPAPGPFDVAFADPPYAFDDWQAIGAVDADLFVAESNREVFPGARWEILRSKRYGSTVVTLFRSS